MIALLAVAGPMPADARSASSNPFGRLFPEFRSPRRVGQPQTLASVPLPRPRPADAPRVEPKVEPRVEVAPAKPVETAKQPQGQNPVAEQKPSEPPPPPPPSACRLALTDQIAIAPSIPDITGPAACGGTDLVRLEAVIVAGKGRVPLKPAATLRCEMATAVAGWIRDDMVPLASSLGTSLAELDNFDSFDCRGRNRVFGAKMSEHGRANALDLRGIKFANGQVVSLTDRAASRETREQVLKSVCTRFTTVLGPGSDGYHEDHIHIDLAARRNGYRICQWTIDEPMPQVAPLLPAERPSEAPPRDMAATTKQAQPAAAQPERNIEKDDVPEPAPQPAKKNRRSGR